MQDMPDDFAMRRAGEGKPSLLRIPFTLETGHYYGYLLPLRPGTITTTATIETGHYYYYYYP